MSSSDLLPKILIFGANGQVGADLQHTMAPLGEVIAYTQDDLDLTYYDQVREAIRSHEPQILINASAYTAVDRAESEKDLAYSINATVPGIMAEEAKNINAAFVHYSTDYVFNGQKKTAYTEDDPVNPINIYGESKLAGEKAVQQIGGAYLIFRTSWVYSLRPQSFLRKVMHWARTQQKLMIVSDQVGSPSSCRMVAEVTAQILAQGKEEPLNWCAEYCGIYNLAGKGGTSRYEWAKAILRYDRHPEEHVFQELLPTDSSNFPTPAKRPEQSILNCSKLEKTFNLRIPEWETTLKLVLEYGDY